MNLKKRNAKMYCCLCGDKVKDGIGNNAHPILDGRCCDRCNATRVIPARLSMMIRGEWPCAKNN